MDKNGVERIVRAFDGDVTVVPNLKAKQETAYFRIIPGVETDYVGAPEAIMDHLDYVGLMGNTQDEDGYLNAGGRLPSLSHVNSFESGVVLLRDTSVQRHSQGPYV